LIFNADFSTVLQYYMSCEARVGEHVHIVMCAGQTL